MSKPKIAASAALAAAASMMTPALAAAAPPRLHAQDLVDQSLSVVRQMKTQPHMDALLHRAKGIFIVPRYGQGGLVVGARGGEGVVLAHLNGRWTDPAFYNIGGVSIGAQAGGAGGSIAMLLMTQNALNDVMGSNNFSFNAKSGLSIVDYSTNAQAGWGRADVIVWDGAKGAYAGATVGVTDIAQDQHQDAAFYKRPATVNQILDDQIHNTGAKPLVHALPA